MSDPLSTRFTIDPIPEDNHEGRQYGYMIRMDGIAWLRCSTGGTGPCWNIEEAAYSVMGEDEPEPAIDLHVCDLDEMIDALTILRDSDAHKANVERWL